MNETSADSAPWKTIEQPIPSFFVDGAVGAAWANGAHRILLAEFVVDPTIGATKPAIRHAINLIMTPDAVDELIAYLQTLPRE